MSTVPVTRSDLEAAAEGGVLAREQVAPLHAFLRQRTADRPRFVFTHVLYYLGGLIAIGAMSLFMTLGWEQFGGFGIFGIAVAYAGLSLVLLQRLRQRRLVLPAGIVGAFVVALTPLAVYGLQRGLGWWPSGELPFADYHRLIRGHWLWMEFATLIVGLCLIAWLRYPFMVMPIAVTVWYMSMDVVAMLGDFWMPWELRALVSMHVGATMIVIAVWVDLRSRHSLDYAFWLYIVGVATFWGGLSAQESHSELAKLGYFGINLLMIGLGVLLARRVFVIFGALGGCGYLAHLASNVFAGSWLFPVALTAAGLGIVLAGIAWQKHEQAWTRACRGWLPAALRELLERRAA